jgi:hypothetical protein
MREIRTSSSMRGRRKRATAQRACALLYACPLAEFEAAPQARIARRSPLHLFSLRYPPWIVLLLVDFPRLRRHASIRTLIAASAAGACWCSQFKGCCHLSAELQGSSYLVPLVLPRPRSHPNPALSHTPQKLNPVPKSILMLLLLFLSPGLPLSLSGCTADRTLPPSPTTYAATPPASAPPPPPPSSSAACCLSCRSPS